MAILAEVQLRHLHMGSVAEVVRDRFAGTDDVGGGGVLRLRLILIPNTAQFVLKAKLVTVECEVPCALLKLLKLFKVLNKILQPA